MPDRRAIIRAGAIGMGAGLCGGMAGTARAAGVQPAGTTAMHEYSGANSYASNAVPRAWDQPQGPGNPQSIDIHTHWAPQSYLDAKAALGRPDFLDPINHDLPRRIRWMDTRGVATLVLTLGGFRPWNWIGAVDGARISALVNDAASEAATRFPDRMLCGIELKVSDPVGALAELNRAAALPGMVMINMPTTLNRHEFLFDEAMQPLLARAQALALPIYLHPLDGKPNWFGGETLIDEASGVDPDEPIGRFPGLTNSLGNSLEMSVTIAKLIKSGLLDRFPDIDFIASMGGGGFPYIGGRMENRGRAARPFYEYLRRFHYDSLVYWPPSMRYLAEMVGSDRIVMATDNMFHNDKPRMDNPHTLVEEAGLAPSDKALIYRGNLARLFRL